MSDTDKKRYYWLKLQRDFFKRHDIKIIESMPNGKDYMLFYLKLLCESISHDGYLRFSDTIPYSVQMLSTITNTNVDIVKSAVDMFSQLDMIKILDDGTYHMLEVQNMIGSETGKAKRMRTYRNSKNATLLPHCSLEKEKELDIELDIDNNIYSANEVNQEKLFDEFWKAYPRKVNKTKAKTSFMRVCRNEEVFNSIMTALVLQKETDQWKDEKYIPHPTTWLNGERWNDEVERGGTEGARDKEIDSIIANSGIIQL